MKKIFNGLTLLFVVLLAIITIFPFIYMILAGLMTYQEATSIPPTLFPETFQFSNYVSVFERAPFVRYFFNTVFVSGVTTISTLITAVLAAFAMVKLEFKHKNKILLVLIALLMVPYESVVFTNYYTIAKMGLLDTYAALIIPSPQATISSST